MTTYSWISYKLHYEIFDRYQQNLNSIATRNLEATLRLTHNIEIMNCQHSETYYLSIKYVAS